MKMMFETEHMRIRKFEPEDAHFLFENHLEDDPYGKGMLIYKREL